MGVFEIAPFDQATKGLVDVLEDLTNKGTITVVGGGDSVAAMEQFGKTKAVSYISTETSFLASLPLQTLPSLSNVFVNMSCS